MNILVIAPHNDDEVLGVGGTIAKYSAQGHHVTVCEVTSGDKTLWKMISEEASAAHTVLGVEDFRCLHLPVVDMRNTITSELNRKFEELVRSIKPEIAFIPHKGDMHVDHQETAKAAMVALRPYSNPQLRAIYAYETLSETEWNIPSVENAFIPDTWNDIGEFIQKKQDAMKCYKSQISDFPNPRSIEAIEALAKLRGSTIGYKYAESFMTIRRKMEDLL